MTETEKIQALVRCRLEQASDALAAAELNLANGLLGSAVNRASNNPPPPSSPSGVDAA